MLIFVGEHAPLLDTDLVQAFPGTAVRVLIASNSKPATRSLPIPVLKEQRSHSVNLTLRELPVRVLTGVVDVIHVIVDLATEDERETGNSMNRQTLARSRRRTGSKPWSSTATGKQTRMRRRKRASTIQTGDVPYRINSL